MNKFTSAREVAQLIRPGTTVATSGFRMASAPEEVMEAIGQRFRESGAPGDLTLVFASAQGDSEKRGLDHFAQPGMLRRIVGGFYGVNPGLCALVEANAVPAYNLPQGQLTRLYHAIATKQPGLITRTGLGTFLDPRIEGGRMNKATTEDLIEVLTIAGKEYLMYRAFPIHVALIRGTTADERGNVSMEREAVRLEALPLACAARASGGIVIVQVERMAESHTIPPRDVELPGYLVDHVVVAQHPEIGHRQSLQRVYAPEYCGELRAPASRLVPLAKDERRVIALRVAQEIRDGAVVNLGSGIPEGVGVVMAEQRRSNRVFLTLESGVSGGVLETQPDFGIAANPDAIIRHDDQFLFYNGGGIDISCLAFAQVDADGNVNVSRFSGRTTGCGGFVDIAQNAKEVVFCGTFTSGGLKTSYGPNGLVIEREGKFRKFIRKVDQITSSGAFARTSGQRIVFVTERCVLEFGANGLRLVEVAAGIDIEKHIFAQMDFRPEVAPKLRIMPAECFG